MQTFDTLPIGRDDSLATKIDPIESEFCSMHAAIYAVDLLRFTKLFYCKLLFTTIPV